MFLRSSLLRARWLLLLLPLFALASTMQVGCNGQVEGRDDFAREDSKIGAPSKTPASVTGTTGSPSKKKPTYGSYDDGYDTYGYDDDDGYYPYE